MKKVLIFSIFALISTPVFGFDYDTIIGPNIPPNPYTTTQKPAQKVDMGPYIRNMQRKVRENWKPTAQDKDKRVVLTFLLKQDGTIDDLQVLKTSGSDSADETAKYAILLTAPFPPLPQGCKDELQIQFVFDNNVLGVSYR